MMLNKFVGAVWREIILLNIVAVCFGPDPSTIGAVGSAEAAILEVAVGNLSRLTQNKITYSWNSLHTGRYHRHNPRWEMV